MSKILVPIYQGIEVTRISAIDVPEQRNEEPQQIRIANLKAERNLAAILF